MKPWLQRGAICCGRVEPETKADLPSHHVEPDVDEATRVRVEVPETAPREHTDRVPTVRSTEPAKAPTVDWLGVGATAGGLLVATVGLLFCVAGFILGLDRWSPDWTAFWTLCFLGTTLGLAPGAVATTLGIRRVSHHAQLRRLVAVARGNDHLDVAQIATLLEVDDKTARKLAVDALTRRLLDARFDAQADRLVLKPSSSPFR